MYCGALGRVLRYAVSMAQSATAPSYTALFRREQLASGEYQLSRKHDAPTVISDPSGRMLKIATVDTASAICPSCATTGRGAYMSFVQDLRMAYACPSCTAFVWLPGA
jgi:hypothetical protein